MNTSDITIRIASPSDAPELLAIYAPYITKTAISFEYDVPSVKYGVKPASFILSRSFPDTVPNRFSTLRYSSP